jgi:hypothetical protein
MSYKESDIKYETKDFWVLDVGKRGFQVMQTGITHSTPVLTVGRNGENYGLPRAVNEANERQAELDAYRQREGLRDYPMGGMRQRG